MPEYLYPGVYVVEVAAGAKPIDGVSTSTADLIGSACIGKLHRLATVPAPEWTHYNEHDPGVTMLELLAWLTESLVCRTERLSDDGVAHASRLAAAALALVSNCEQPQGSVLMRAHFYSGRRLNEEEFRVEQDYLLPRRT